MSPAEGLLAWGRHVYRGHKRVGTEIMVTERKQVLSFSTQRRGNPAFGPVMNIAAAPSSVLI
jgi:hypothetical protein